MLAVAQCSHCGAVAKFEERLDMRFPRVTDTMIN